MRNKRKKRKKRKRREEEEEEKERGRERKSREGLTWQKDKKIHRQLINGQGEWQSTRT